MKNVLITSLLLASAVFTSNAFAKDARCKIFMEGEVDINQICTFTAWGNEGSFILSPKNRKGILFNDNKTLWVRMQQKNVAELGTDLVNGHSQRWGVTLIRSTRDRACWENERGDIQICAY